MTLILYGTAAVVVVVIAYYIIYILREYERGVVFFLGRFQTVMGPGLIVLIPGVQQLVLVDLRTRVLDVPTQDLITRDNVSVKVSAVIYFRVFEPEKAIVQVEDFQTATSQLAQTTLRSVLGQHELDQLLAERDKLNSDIQASLDHQTSAWGIKVSNVEIKQVDLNETMVRAIAKQAEAERTRRAKVIAAEGEFQASEKLKDAAKVLSEHSEALTLRYLQTLLDMSTEKTSTILFPIPIDLLAAFKDHMSRGTDSDSGSS
ncbi:MAG: slipin family protein [Gammaproteobacteria bacterium]|nr:MAG: slipin family protein [Gammaproteobacteria bacterium]